MRIALLSILLAGCTLYESSDPGPGDDQEEPGPGGNDDPPPDGGMQPSICGDGTCASNEVGECTLDCGTPSDPSGPGPIGRSFLLQRTVLSGQCTHINSNTPLFISVEVNAVDAGEASTSGVMVRPEPARQANGDPANVTFVAAETWMEFFGNERLSAHFEIWVDGDLITGVASATFDTSLPGQPQPTCSYTWSVDGLESE